ncbi:atpase subunit c domain protein [Ophiostoma piceae UAMH 11346]|uniref:Atpase subunit c domain protein n=1 Tax=Ophiostoma piceae (strain UAMH 11346) TaxID=1262450 RepID=S3C7Y4_OPHP1|nr:atpase subunit c domain protein [Ophiostoma piceae UAMH 11346]
MDYSKLRATALRDGEAEEAVTVDTRALIDKVLARYSGEWTTLRELIQNAADAQATTVKIKWETTPSVTVPLPSSTTSSANPSGGTTALSSTSGADASNTLLQHTILHHTLHRLLVENDGQSFTKTDWARLKRIAEGNPDETKIGAFGVGFYSVFADCEEPFVSSGREAMAFYWKGNALFTRKLVLPEDEADPTQKPKTTFVLDYRNATTALPNLLSVSQFLATSLTFVALQKIEFWIDDWKILDLRKDLSASTAVSVPRNLDMRTKEGLMTVAAIERSSARIDATYMHAVSWKPPASTSGSGLGTGSIAGSGPASSSASNSKSTDTYGISAGDLPSLKSFFSRFTSASTKDKRTKAVREEQAVQDTVLQNLTSEGRASIFLRVTTASVKTNVAANFASELERATKKPPPKTTRMAILTSSYEDAKASKAAAKLPSPESGENAAMAVPAADIFASVLPSQKPGGRIFIGFPTQQTTGAGMHISAPSLIPTVEREAIDLNARWVRNWNMELLRVAGILSRLAFINEMSDLDTKFRRYVEENRAAAAGTNAVKNNKVVAIPTPEEIAKFVPEALHVLKTYTYGDSTPSAYVSQIVEESFWTTCKEPTLDIFSSRGVMSTTKVRLESEEVSKFVNGIPVVVEQMKDSPFIQKLHEFGIIQDVTIEDVRSELESKPLDRTQLVHFVKWIASGASSRELDPPSVRSLLRVAVASMVDPEKSEGSVTIIELRGIQNYLSGNKVPANLPLPPSTMPFSITNTVPLQHLVALGWTQLDLVPWLEYLLTARQTLGSEYNMTEHPPFAAQVLQVLSKNWENMSIPHKTVATNLLKSSTCMPTKMGMKKPGDAFFPTVKLFDDLPVLSPSCQNLKDRFLLTLGVRKTVDLDTIFTRLMAQSVSPAKAAEQEKGEARANKTWSHVELIKYLASVRSDIPESDMRKLRESAFCPAEAGPLGQESTIPSNKLYRANELFEPSDTVRDLGFPIIQWPDLPNNYFRKSSTEAKFLSELGLRMRPTAQELVHKMTSPDAAMREKARNYFTTNHAMNGYNMFRMSTVTSNILPIMGEGHGAGAGVTGGSNDKKGQSTEETLVPPSGCYTNVSAAVLGFTILRSDLHAHASKFGVAADPPIEQCVNRLLANPPKSHNDAVTVFTYFSTRIGSIYGDTLKKLQNGAFIPVTRKSQSGAPVAPALNANGYPDEKKMPQRQSEGTVVEYLWPSACYLGSSSTYGEIFDFIDFGANANAFLFKCGSKSEPTKIEIARLACSEPARLLSTLQTTERYFNLLRSLAEDLPRLKADRELFRKMKSSPFLLASREISRQPDQPNQPSSGMGGLFSSSRKKSADDDDDDASFATDADDEPPIKHFQLVAPSQIVILDDYISYRLFKDKLLCAPEEDVLENFYVALGAQMLSSVVREEVTIGSSVPNSETQAASLRSFVLERSKIFLFEYQKYRHDVIKHDHKWLENKLDVIIVQSVALRRTLSGSRETHTEKRSAASTGSTSRGHVLYVSSRGKPDMYQIGQAVCQLVLSRQSQQAYFFFEPFLKLDLLELRARGYNVDRVLRAKAAEARVAEEERRKAYEAEQKRFEEAEQDRMQKLRSEDPRGTEIAAARSANNRTPEPKMPGAFEDSPSPINSLAHRGKHSSENGPEETGLQSLFGKKNIDKMMGGGLLSDFSKRFGFGGADSNPPPGQNENPSTAVTNTNNNAGVTTPAVEDGRVTSPATIQQNMLSAINASRPYGSSSVFQPPKTNTVKEQASYCDHTPAQDIVNVAKAPRGMDVFLSKEITTQQSPALPEFLTRNRGVVASFELLLLDVAAVYGLAAGVVHMYYDNQGPTIAFNLNGSIFCNMRFYMQLHAPFLTGAQVSSSVQPRIDATVWWWVVVAHELAHNLESSHNANHSYYTESFVQQYFAKMMVKTASWTSAGRLALPAPGGSDNGEGSSSQPAPPSYQQATESLL